MGDQGPLAIYVCLALINAHSALRWKERFEPDWWMDALLALLCAAGAVREAVW